jgi:hypothetical protein
MNPIRLSLRYPQVTLVLTGMMVIAGLFALFTMPRREDPKITIRSGLVTAIDPGATSEEVEAQVTHKIEERLFRFAEVRRAKTFSTTRNGVVIVNVELNESVQNADVFWSKLRLEMTQLKTELPEGVQGPFVDSDFGDTVAVLIGVHANNYSYSELKSDAERIETHYAPCLRFRRSSALANKTNASTLKSRNKKFRNSASIRSMSSRHSKAIAKLHTQDEFPPAWIKPMWMREAGSTLKTTSAI